MDGAAYVFPRTFKPTGDLPEELTGADRWICWQYGAKIAGGKPTKIPTTPAGGPLVKWQKDPLQWMTYGKAVAAYNANPQLSGIGFVLAPELGIVGVDMDHAINADTGELAEWAQPHIAEFDTYTEISPSGTGFRLFSLGALPDGCRKKVGHREIYNGGRWLTVTGNVWNDSPIVARPDAVASYIKAMNAEAAPTSTSGEPGSASGIQSSAALIREFMTADNLHDSSCALAFRLIDDGMKPGKVVEFLRACMDAMPNKGDIGRWQARRFDIPKLVGSAEEKHKATEAAEAKPSLVIASLAGFSTRDLPPPQYAVESLIPRKVVTLLGAHGGSGKSVLALSMAAHFAASRKWADLATAGGRVLFVSLEDSADLVLYRLRRVIEAHGLDVAAVERNLIVVDGTEGDGSLAYESVDFGARKLWPTPNMQRVKELAAGTGLIIIDNASDAFDGDENNRRMVRAFVRMLAQIARANDAGLLLLAHIDKQSAKYGAQGNSYSGSTAWHNSARSRLALIKEGDALELRQEKINLGRKADPVALRFNEHGVLLPSTGGAPVVGIMDAGDDAGVLAAMRAANAAGVNVNTGRSGNSTTQHVLQTFPELPQALKGPSGRARFWAALERLRRAGCASSENYTDKHRHTNTRFVARQGV